MMLPPIKTGIDRFIAQRWADYAIDLLIGSDSTVDLYARLKNWLDQEITGKESSMKTASQIRRLWLNPEGNALLLRNEAIHSGIANDLTLRPILHLGMAINVFPLFREVCEVIGRLYGLQGVCTRKETCRRVMEKFGNPTSIPRGVSRVFQTLTDWQLLKEIDKTTYKIRQVQINNPAVAGWFLQALLLSRDGQQLSISDLKTMPERLGVVINDEREVIRVNPNLITMRDGMAVEKVGIKL